MMEVLLVELQFTQEGEGWRNIQTNLYSLLSSGLDVQPWEGYHSKLIFPVCSCFHVYNTDIAVYFSNLWFLPLHCLLSSKAKDLQELYQQRRGRQKLDCPNWIWNKFDLWGISIWQWAFWKSFHYYYLIFLILVCVQPWCVFCRDMEQETDCVREAVEKEHERCAHDSCFDINKSFCVLPSPRRLTACSASCLPQPIFISNIISKIFHQNISSIILLALCSEQWMQHIVL